MGAFGIWASAGGAFLEKGAAAMPVFCGSFEGESEATLFSWRGRNVFVKGDVPVNSCVFFLATGPLRACAEGDGFLFKRERFFGDAFFAAGFRFREEAAFFGTRLIWGVG